MKLGIIAAMEQELKVLTDQLDNMTQTTIANQHFYEGQIEQVQVVLVQSGIGKVNAAIATTLLINSFKADSIINTGSAGGIGNGLKVGDLVIATELTYNDADARAFGYSFGQIPQMPELYDADAHMIGIIGEAAEASNWRVKNGLIVTGDSFISSKDKINEIRQHFSEALVTEMEGTAVAQTCYQFNIPFAVVRAVSDVADEEASLSFNDFIDLAGQKSADMVIQFLKLVKKE
ncbi:5'-methylthioadenosine/adenosylhomocysteine nucleosidase [Alkalibacterium olivapovliticus]|uniref:5'-methylthioadenosine/S-adenosylhomocysteine nucleosidase n=1 Tax=Alkalibacterium olivapovliticus TaxID=99907 RepID=A0A2T0WB62_9LACT|nr:5'-methylthioadenosine/adenosylhomocysteine nucleosidase [Alkalibacterium olivapovliticus]PRY83941.1 adenosylhomocysteine nucleosidase [Alkalibacterium olivapovliticus]